jgi:transposase
MRKAFGIDLFELPGFATETVLTVFSEVGNDFTKFRSADAFASWLALCPNNEKTGGKIKSSKSRHTKSRLAAALRQAAYSLANSKSHYGSLYRRTRAKAGPLKAVTAMANKLAKLLYVLVTTGREFDENEFATAESKMQALQQRRLHRNAHRMGFELVPI